MSIFSLICRSRLIIEFDDNGSWPHVYRFRWTGILFYVIFFFCFLRLQFFRFCEYGTDLSVYPCCRSQVLCTKLYTLAIGHSILTFSRYLHFQAFSFQIQAIGHSISYLLIYGAFEIAYLINNILSCCFHLNIKKNKNGQKIGISDHGRKRRRSPPTRLLPSVLV